MGVIKDLKKDIEEAIYKIESLTPEDVQKVHDIYVLLFDKYSKLKQDNFYTETCFIDYQNLCVATLTELKPELKGLLEKDSYYTDNNFRMITLSLNTLLSTMNQQGIIQES